MNRQPDEVAIKKTLDEEVPPLFDYLEQEVGDKKFLAANRFTVADIGVATQFVNFKLAGCCVDVERWPHVCPPSLGADTHTLLWFATEASRRVHAPFAFPSPSIVERVSLNERSSLASCAQQSNHPRPADTAEGEQGNGTHEIDKRREG